MDVNLFNKNLKAIEQVNKNLYLELKKRDDDSNTWNKNKFIFEKARNKSWTVKVKNDRGQSRFLHSSYNPEREAERWVKKYDFEGKSQLFITGLGLGYHLQKILDLKEKASSVIIFEPELEILYKALYLYDYSKYINKNELTFIVDINKNQMFFLLDDINILNLNDIILLELPICKYYRTEKFTEIKNYINDYFMNKHIQTNTNIIFKEEWLNNFKYNFKYLYSCPGINLLKDIFSDLPVIIVSAGPSLDKNIHLLKQAQDKAIIIAVDTALRVVLETGVTPDIVVSLDGKEKNWKHYEGLNYDNIVLVSDIVSHYKIFKNHSGYKFIFYTSAHYLSESILSDTENRRLVGGGSVATSALELAFHMGDNPVILIGQDLALGKDGLTHAQGTVFRRRMTKGKKLYRVKGIDGKEVLTRPQLYTYLKWFERRIEALPDSFQVIDATEGGALIEGSIVMPFDEAIKKYCKTNINVQQKIEACFNEFTAIPEQNVLDELLQKKDYLSKLKEISEEGIEKAREFGQLEPEDKKAINHLLDQLNEIDKKIKEIEEGNNLSQLAAFADIIKTIYDKKVNLDLESHEAEVRLKAAAKKSENLYRSLNDSYDFMINYLNEILKMTESKNRGRS